MEDAKLLTSHELKILREMNGDLRPSAWGSWVAVCLEHLHGRGFITKTLGGQITDTGKQYPKEHQP